MRLFRLFNRTEGEGKKQQEAARVKSDEFYDAMDMEPKTDHGHFIVKDVGREGAQLQEKEHEENVSVRDTATKILSSDTEGVDEEDWGESGSPKKKKKKKKKKHPPAEVEVVETEPETEPPLEQGQLLEVLPEEAAVPEANGDEYSKGKKKKQKKKKKDGDEGAEPPALDYPDLPDPEPAPSGAELAADTGESSNYCRPNFSQTAEPQTQINAAKNKKKKKKKFKGWKVQMLHAEDVAIREMYGVLHSLRASRLPVFSSTGPPSVIMSDRISTLGLIAEEKESKAEEDDYLLGSLSGSPASQSPVITSNGSAGKWPTHSLSGGPSISIWDHFFK